MITTRMNLNKELEKAIEITLNFKCREKEFDILCRATSYDLSKINMNDLKKSLEIILTKGYEEQLTFKGKIVEYKLTPLNYLEKDNVINLLKHLEKHYNI